MRSRGQCVPVPQTKWLLLCAFFIGCGFLTTMLQAWIVVPASALAYLVGSGAPVHRGQPCHA